MNYIDCIKDNLNRVTTENGDGANSSTGSSCLDFYSLIGGLRYNYKEIVNVFIRAFYEDKIKAIKILFYARDIRGGLGERNSFRMILNFLGNFYPEIAKQLILYIPEYGRYDDLYSLFNTTVAIDVLDFIKEQLEIDIKLNSQGQTISLLSKWLPSINTSNEDARLMARIIAKHLNLSHKDYRKTLSTLRKGRIIENNLREKDYTFDYNRVPSQAMNKYYNAFLRNDEERYIKYLADVELGRARINTDTLFPYQIIQPIFKDTTLDKNQRIAINTTWNSLKRFNTDRKSIVVLDGSGSMYHDNSKSPICIATSLAIYFAEILPTPFKNNFITFSSRPKLVTLPDGDIYDKVIAAISHNEVANTNISRVYNLLLKIATENKISQVDMIDQVIIISDMEFDECAEGFNSFEKIKKTFTQAGYVMPELVFWNVEARNIHSPVTINEKNVKLVSGSSTKIFEMVLSQNVIPITPYEFMEETLTRYQEFDKIII